jgi:hypothetical protein
MWGRHLDGEGAGVSWTEPHHLKSMRDIYMYSRRYGGLVVRLLAPMSMPSTTGICLSVELMSPSFLVVTSVAFEEPL